MQKSYSPSDYLYASARIRAIEASLISREQIGTLLEGASVRDVIAALADAAGVSLPADAKENDIEAALLSILKAGVLAVATSVPDPRIVHLVQFPYDCHNLKTYIKCHYRGIDPAPLMIDAGSVPADALPAALGKGDLSPLPRHLAAAFAEVKEAYAKTADPREIDFLLDRALFEDLAEAAKVLPLAEKTVSARADLTNCITCLRLLRGKNAATSAALFHKSMLPAGTLGEDFFAVAFEDGEEALLAALLSKTPYGAVAKDAAHRSPAELEKRADDYITALLLEVKHLPFGGEIPLAYLFAIEGALKNLRILLSGKKAGLEASSLRERVRESYV